MFNGILEDYKRPTFPCTREIGDDNEINLVFQAIPTKTSLKEGYSIVQKITKSIGDAGGNVKIAGSDEIFSAVIPLLSKGVANLFENFSGDDLLKIIETHSRYMRVVEEGSEKPFNIEYHLSEKPDLVMDLVVEIIKVYYMGFMIGFLKRTGILSQMTKALESSPQKPETPKPGE